MGGTNWKRLTAIKGTMNHAKTPPAQRYFVCRHGTWLVHISTARILGLRLCTAIHLRQPSITCGTTSITPQSRCPAFHNLGRGRSCFISATGALSSWLVDMSSRLISAVTWVLSSDSALLGMISTQRAQGASSITLRPSKSLWLPG
jgi:hypothetical protein